MGRLFRFGLIALLGASGGAAPVAFGQEEAPSQEGARVGLHRIERAPVRGSSIPTGWREDPQKHRRAWMSQLGGADYLAALEATGMAEHLAKRGAVGAGEQEGGEDAVAGSSSWTLTGPVGGFGAKGDNGRVSGLQLVRHGTTDWVYAGACGGGLWRSDLASVGVWESVGDNLPNPSVKAFAVHPTDPQRIVVGTGDALRYKGAGLFLTTNGGGSWTQVAPAPIPGHFYRIHHALDDAQIMVAASDDGLLRSTDAGVSWTRVGGGDWTDLVLHPTNASVMYAVRAGTGVYESTNKGASFTLLTSPSLPATGNWERSSLAICRDEPDTVALLVEKDGNVFGVYRSTDGGTSWTDVTSNLGSGTFGGGQASHCQALAFRPTDGDEILLGTQSIARSYWDAGAGELRWKIDESAAGIPIGHADVTHLVHSAIAGDDYLWIANDGGLFLHHYPLAITVSLNGNQTTGLAISQIDHLDADRTMEAIGLQDNGTLRSVTTPATWERISTGDGGHVQISDAEQFDLWFWAGMPWHPKRARYGQPVESLPNPPAASWFHHDPVANKVWAAGAQNIYSADADAVPVVWTTEVSGGTHPDPTHGIRTIWGSQLESGTLYLSYGYGLDGDVTVTRKGTPWTFHTTQGLAPNGWIESVTPSSEWPGECWLGCKANPGDPKVFHTTDYGVTWTDVSGSLSAVGSVYAVVPQPFDPLTLYAATDVGMFRSLDGGASWAPFQDGMPIVAVRGLSFVVDDAHSGTHELRAASYGRGTWERDVVASPIVYVDRAYVGSEDGTYEHPWNTVAEGVSAAPPGAIVAVRSSTYDEPQVVTKNVKILTYMDRTVIR